MYVGDPVSPIGPFPKSGRLDVVTGEEKDREREGTFQSSQRAAKLVVIKSYEVDMH